MSLNTTMVNNAQIKFDETMAAAKAGKLTEQMILDLLKEAHRLTDKQLDWATNQWKQFKTGVVEKKSKNDMMDHCYRGGGCSGR